jgi:recombination protein RecT
MEVAFRDAVASGLKPETLVRDAITAMRNTPDLVKCEESTFFGAVMSAGQLGLRPNVPSLGHGWVLPFWSGRRQRHEAQWVLGYQGMVELGYKSGLVAKITTDTIYSNETYRVRRGTADELVHEPILDESERGEIVAHYAIVWLQTGQALWRVMSDQDVRRIMERMAARDRNKNIVGPWRDDYLPMAQKTPLRALWRFMPKTEILSLALQTDGAVRELDAVRPGQRATATSVRDGDDVEPDTAGSTDEPVDADVVPEPEPGRDDATPTDGAAARQALRSNATRKGLIAALESKHGADWAIAAQIVGVTVADAPSMDYLSTDELRAALALTPETVAEFVAG